jgi:hypothetical protein
LFERGQLEEARFVGYLKDIGCQVWEFDDRLPPKENGEKQQFRISDHFGHFGGSLDGVILGLPEFPTIATLGEFKTHNEKSFKKFESQLLIEAKFEHYVQMQIYMGKMMLQKGLYMAACKNDDDLYLEFIDFHHDVCMRYLERAKQIIFSPDAPPKINESPAWYECQYCAYRDICHADEIAALNCRTCAFSTPVEKKKWHCAGDINNPDGVIMRPDNLVLRTGCHKHIFHPDMIGGSTLVSTDPNKEFLLLQDNFTGHQYRHGPKFLTSQDLIDKVPF